MFLFDLALWPLWLMFEILEFLLSTLFQALVLGAVGIVLLRLSGRHDAGQQQIAEIASVGRSIVGFIAQRVLTTQNAARAPADR